MVLWASPGELLCFVMSLYKQVVISLIILPNRIILWMPSVISASLLYMTLFDFVNRREICKSSDSVVMCIRIYNDMVFLPEIIFHFFLNSQVDSECWLDMLMFLNLLLQLKWSCEIKWQEQLLKKLPRHSLGNVRTVYTYFLTHIGSSICTEQHVCFHCCHYNNLEKQNFPLSYISKIRH